MTDHERIARLAVPDFDALPPHSQAIILQTVQAQDHPKVVAQTDLERKIRAAIEQLARVTDVIIEPEPVAAPDTAQPKAPKKAK